MYKFYCFGMFNQYLMLFGLYIYIYIYVCVFPIVWEPSGCLYFHLCAPMYVWHSYHTPCTWLCTRFGCEYLYCVVTYTPQHTCHALQITFTHIIIYLRNNVQISTELSSFCVYRAWKHCIAILPPAYPANKSNGACLTVFGVCAANAWLHSSKCGSGGQEHVVVNTGANRAI